MSTPKGLSFKEDAELAIGATSAVVAADQVVKSMDSTENQLEHILKAGVGAAVAIGAYEMLRRAELDPKSSSSDRPIYHDRARRYSGSSRLRSSSHSPDPSHHKRHIFEEILGAYALGKELMGDKKHHVVHLVGEAIGAIGLAQELRSSDKEHEEHKHN